MTSFALVVVKCMWTRTSTYLYSHLKTIFFFFFGTSSYQGSTVTVVFLLPGSDEEMDKLAEEEEEEALALQKHMAACLEEQDFDTAEFEVRSSWSLTSHRHTRWPELTQFL